MVEEHKVLKDINFLRARYQEYVNKGLNLDMTRGKPCPEQLDLSANMLTNITNDDLLYYPYDFRNYTTPALLSGLPECKTLFSEILDIPSDNIIIGGNSSLNLMYDTIVRALLHRLPGANQSWSEGGKIKFLCPVPGYDRHFNICESLDIEMINIPMDNDGPDINLIESLVKKDPQIKGIWCVPKYSNPTGITYSDHVIERLANMDTAASDFRIFWDNAYVVHHLSDNEDKLKNIMNELQNNENRNRVFMFVSTSKITHAGGGISALITSDANKEWFLSEMKNQTIGFDKINQLRHVKFFDSLGGVVSLMDSHKAILSPKFNEVDSVLSHELGLDGIYATWTKPNGGYFVSFDSKPGCATKIVEMSAKAGVKLTKAGATFPYGVDPSDSNIRIAPSLPSVYEIKQAMQVLAIVTKIVTFESK